MNITNFKKSDYIFLLIVFIGFYLLYRFSISTNDDNVYLFIAGMSGGVDGQYIPVDSFKDAVLSQKYDYMYANGRVIIHALTSYFLGVVGLDIFRILNSIVFVLLLLGLIKLLRSEFGYNRTDKYIILFLLFFLMPDIKGIFLGHVAFVMNYLWTACAIVYFIILYRKIKYSVQFKTIVNILLFIVGLLIGSLQESFSIGISGALFIYYCFNFKEFKGSIIWLVIGFWIGTCIVTLAPGNFLKLESYPIGRRFDGLIKYVSNLGYLICNSKLSVISIILMIITYLSNKNEFKNFIKKNQLFLLSNIFNGIIVIITYAGERQLTSIELFSLILIIKLLYINSAAAIERHTIIINTVIIISILCIYPFVYKYRKLNYNKYENFSNRPVIGGTIVDKDYLSINKYLNDRSISKYYVGYTGTFINTEWGQSLLRTKGRDLEYVKLILPIDKYELEELFDKRGITESKNIYVNNEDYEYIHDSNDIYYFRVPQDNEIVSLKYVATPKLLGKLRSYIFNTPYTQLETINSTTTYIYNNYRYYIMDPNPNTIIKLDVKVDIESKNKKITSY